MKVLLLDNATKRGNQIREALEEKNVEVVFCSTSNDFMEVIGDSRFDKIALNVDFWDKGKAIYNYFGIGKKVENIPFLFYNADENFTSISERSKNEMDQISHKPVDVDAIVNAALIN